MKKKWTELKGDLDNPEITGAANTRLLETDRSRHKRKENIQKV